MSRFNFTKLEPGRHTFRLLPTTQPAIRTVTKEEAEKMQQKRPCLMCEVGIPARPARPMYQENGGVTYTVKESK